MPALNVDEVRRAAQDAELDEIYYNETSRVISFADGGDPQTLTRINVYYTTGTVGTCVDHPRQGRTQLFRRDVDMALLRELMRDPRLHTGTGYHQRRKMPRRDPCVVCMDKDDSCVVCMDAPKAFAFVPCGHFATCEGCSAKVMASAAACCPYCRAPCREVLRMYFT